MKLVSLLLYRLKLLAELRYLFILFSAALFLLTAAALVLRLILAAAVLIISAMRAFFFLSRLLGIGFQLFFRNLAVRSPTTMRNYLQTERYASL